MRTSFFAIIVALLITGCNNSDNNVLEASGTIEGTDIDIGSEVAGRILAIYVDEGNHTRVGDTLVIVDDTEYQIQLRQATANAAAASAQYRLALEGSRQEDVIQAEAAFRAADADYRRMKDLLASQTVTRKQFDDAESRFVAAEQTYQKLSRGLRKEEVEMARARNEQAAAQVDQLRKKIRDCVLTAPAAATVTLRAFEPGELVSPGTNVLRLTELDTVHLLIYVNGAVVGKLRIGQSASVTIDARPDHPFQGKVVYISPNAEFTPKNVQTKEERTKLVFAVKIRIPNPDGSLKTGIPADARIVLNAEQDQ